MASAIKLAIAGAGGRMGQMLLDAAAADAAVAVAAALEHAASPLLGREVAPGVKIAGDLAVAIAASDTLIDFTRPEGTLEHLAVCRRLGKAIVIGTTGFDDAGKAAIESAAKEIPVVFAPNMSVGVNVTFKLVEMAAKSLGMDYDIEVFEAHHKMKVDAPSGTALKLGELAAESRGQDFDDAAVFDRHGITGVRKPGGIGFSVVRAGDIVGDHTVYFVGGGERIEITHRSTTRANYAQGALRAAKFLSGKKNGLFDMADVLGL